MNTEDTNVARTRTTHKQSRERNARFAEMAQEPEIKKYLDNMPKSTHISYLRNIRNMVSMSHHQQRIKLWRVLMIDLNQNTDE